MKQLFLLVFAALVVIPSFGQMKPKLHQNEKNAPRIPAPVQPFRAAVPTVPPVFSSEKNFGPIQLPKPVKNQLSLKAYVSQKTGTPYFIEGYFEATAGRSVEQQAFEYLNAVQPVLKVDSPADAFVLSNMETDELGVTHLHLQQVWKGVPVHGAEVVLHKRGETFFMLNGRFFPTPALADVTPVISKEQAELLALNHVADVAALKNLSLAEKKLLGASQQTEAELVIFHPGGNPGAERLAWRITVLPNLASRYRYFLDAKTGEVLQFHNELCNLKHDLLDFHSGSACQASKNSLAENIPLPAANYSPTTLLDGPATANALDLFGISRLIHTYQVGSTYYLIDASRTMFASQASVLPDEPVGVIWTIDALNTSPETDAFQATHLTSSNNSWNNPKAVSAHFNGGKAYEYFKNTHQRESINGMGGNVVSLINVAEDDGGSMDNAFWNGAAMFYGNGDVGFTAPLCKALDVAGHEISHGVVQTTANLEYIGESGALNESFADVFGAMIDRNDWQIGEDVVNSNIFPSGALRDLSNPHNGGNDLNDPGYQPAHYSERFLGSEDNGGVHINSGIPNRAFFLFANSANVGKDKAEKVYYRALANYLFKSAQFVDARIAVVQAAADLHGANSAEVNAAKAAFDAVGIGAGSGTDPETDIGENPGEEFILLTDDQSSALYLFTPDGQAIANPFSGLPAPLSRPSVTDDGSVFVYISQDNRMNAVTLDWANGTFDHQVIQNEQIWRNVAISRDGNHLAAITTDNDNRLYVTDSQGDFSFYELYNPTTGDENQKTGDVLYADVLEWDLTGEWVMYDALNSLNTLGNDIEYWDISFISVWNNELNDYGDGYVGKLFSGLPENVSVGNPTFAKNSDYIIAFDYFDEFEEEYFLLATNFETGEVGTIFENSDLSWPNYSVDDKRMVFDAFDTQSNPVLAFISLGSDKISAVGNASIFLDGGRSGVWFANGERVLLDAKENASEQVFQAYPNPAGDWLTLDFTSEVAAGGQVQVFDLLGKLMSTESFDVQHGKNRRQVSLGGLPAGNYLVRLSAGENAASCKVVKR